MIKFNQSDKKIILGSSSPRRKELLAGLGIDFQIRTKDTDEVYPQELPKGAVPVFLAELKAEAISSTLKDSEVLITSDTVVLYENEILGKPKDYTEAVEMLRKLSGKSHDVLTGVHLRSIQSRKSFDVLTKVFFKTLSDEMIEYYVNTYKPYDKAGAYGIQEWLGNAAIYRIEGSYSNVMGLPVSELWDELQDFLNRIDS
jgi:septum formation protein